jgi:hypothetical protein
MATDDEAEERKLAVERAKSLLRVEETFPDAEQCEACKKARADSGDPTFLCDEHLRRIYGV